MTPQDQMEYASSATATAIAVTVFFLIYFAPTFNAMRRRHHNKIAIFILNLLLGWSFIGWIIAFIWSWTQPEIIIRYYECVELHRKETNDV